MKSVIYISHVLNQQPGKIYNSYVEMWTETTSIFDFIYKNGYYRIEGNKQRGTVERKSEETMWEKIAELWRNRHSETRSGEKERKEWESRWQEGRKSINVRKYERGRNVGKASV